MGYFLFHDFIIRGKCIFGQQTVKSIHGLLFRSTEISYVHCDGPNVVIFDRKHSVLKISNQTPKSGGYRYLIEQN